MNKAEYPYSVYFYPSSSSYFRRFLPWSRIQGTSAINLVQPAGVAMTEHNTRSKTTDRLEDAVLRLTQTHHDLSLCLDAMQEQLQLLQIQHQPQPPPLPPPLSPPSSRHHIKLDVAGFDGTDAMGWIFRISHFFEYHHTPDEERVTIASFYMDGPALSWYQWMYRNDFITSWAALLQALETRFVPTYYDDPKGTLFKLTHTGTVNEYLHEFERLANRIIGFPSSCLLSCFISGLAPKLH